MAKFFRMDIRSLALFRVLAGLLILLDLALRLRDLSAHYTDFGVLPIDEAVKLSGYSGGLTSLHFMSGSPLFQLCLFFFAACFALMLIAGWRTQLATILSWVFLVSLQDRNTLILNGGDILFRLMLFWGIFLPLGACASIDSLQLALRRKNDLRGFSEREDLDKLNSEELNEEKCSLDSHSGKAKKSYSLRNVSLEKKSGFSSLATFAFLLQFCLVYWAGCLFKWKGGWLEGDAVYYALNIDQFATPYAVWLRQYEGLVPFLTYSVYSFELLGPFFLFSPWKTGQIRTAVVFLFIMMHAFFGIFLHLGIFSLIAIVGWCAILPGWFWDRVLGPEKEGEAVPPLSFPERGLVALCILLTIMMNIFSLYPRTHLFGSPDHWKLAASVFRMNQHWPMFSRPLRNDGWYIYQGKLANGELVDLFHTGRPLTWEKPPSGISHYPNARWRKYLMNLWDLQFKEQRKNFLKYLARNWNNTHPMTEKVVGVDMYYVVNSTPKMGKKRHHPSPVPIWRYRMAKQE